MGRLSRSKKEDGEEESGVDTLIMVGDGCFILILLTTLFLILRQTLKLLSQFRPPSPPSSTSSVSPSQEGEAPWTLPALPSYVDAVGRTQRTGDVEDRWIVGECLPRYGDERGSKLLLRSRSAEVGLLRGGPRGRIEVINPGEEVQDGQTQGGDRRPEGGLQVHVDGEGGMDPPEGEMVVVNQDGGVEKDEGDATNQNNEK
ncbi:hypothetical protein I302_102412 [Kwoniella bestiolae CBS 10118]|uniref:Uncharacterized protein n=1 Tax=Kwoniella bestiolae CBS 10118 TaxID=1296100 RepID=A0A1B9GEZ0_9TREE|nr:hypothetical protein I302_01102 [Kwoniella bestiolae CBS 10118]OCF29593.1 hypothetical protein I302_01102 [Kwoniella bestiolae CBS 10118]